MQRRERFGDSGNLVKNKSNRPTPETARVYGQGAQIVRERAVPMTEFRIVRGRAIGGGTSVDAVRRARKRLANGS